MGSSRSTTISSQTKTLGKLYIPSKSRTPLARLRETLDEAERAVTHLGDGGYKAVDLLHLLDQIADQLEDLDERGVDARVERTRLETIERRLKRRQASVSREVGKALEEERRNTQPERSRWWWYLDEAVAQDRRSRWKRLIAVAALTIALLAGAWQAYRHFLAPPPEVAQAYRHVEDGRTQLDEGHLEAALADFQSATALTPNDPEPWLWKGVLLQHLEEPAAAGEAFATANGLYDSTFDFLINRGGIYLEAGDTEKARDDAAAAIDLEPDRGWGYYLRAAIAAHEGHYADALVDLERANELAQANGNRRLQALAARQKAQTELMRLGGGPGSD